MIRRARLISVLALLAAGAIGVISSTQAWLVVTLDDGAAEPLTVAGADAIALLTPLSLAALALGAALSIVGRGLRYVFGVLAVLIGGALLVLTARIVLSRPVDAAASAVTEATGITGIAAVEDLIAAVDLTPWPFVTTLVWVVMTAAGVLVLATAHLWRPGDRRYRTDEPAIRRADPSRPPDAIDSWDDLSRGEDPTR